MAVKKTIPSLFRLCFLIVLLLFVIVIIRTFTVYPRKISAPKCKSQDEDFIEVEGEILGRFQKAIQFQSVSYTPHMYEAEEMGRLRDFILNSYPSIHSSPLVQHEVVANYSLLYSIKGSDPSLKPFLLMGHIDVVPVENPEKWEAPPFEGRIKDGFIYGRGTIDDKHTVFGILEALEFLLKRGHKPRRAFYLAFGHDEETTGVEGASNLAHTLYSRGVRDLKFVLDEGMTVLDGLIPGMDKPVALLENNPHPSMFGTGPERATFEHIAHKMSLPFRAVMSNLWLFSPVVSWFLSRKPETNAIVRTTTSVTMFHAGVKINVIAPYAEAFVNHRIHPSSSVQEVLAYDKWVVDDDRINWEILASMEPLPQSPYGDTDFGYHTIRTSIEQIWGYAGVTVAPGTMIGNTDTIHYTRLSRNIFRFSPTYMYPGDPARFHGVNERLSVKNLQQAVNFFYHLMKNADEAELKPLHKHGEEL